MKYQIEIDYDSYDSFNEERCQEPLEGTWENIDVIKRNLQRIKEHYIYNEEKNSTGKYRRYEEFAQINYDIDKKDWVVVNKWASGENISENSLMLELDNGKMYQVQAFWMGWGSSFHGAKAVFYNDPELEITV